MDSEKEKKFFYKITVAYDGTRYLGWQKTKTGPSIQESLEEATRLVTGEKTLPEGASRTDRGVHAIGQVACIQITSKWNEVSLQNALNAVLPRDIRIKETTPAPSTFHPTLDAVEKEYLYRICTADVQTPFNRLYSWYLRCSLNLEKMNAASTDLLGEHDFSAFANEPKTNPFCLIQKISLEPDENHNIAIKITGNRFLYKMVRNIVGTLVYIGCGKLSETVINEILASKNRKTAGVTAPAHGLALYRVKYNS